MSLTKNIESYSDVERVFRMAQMNKDGGAIRLGDNKAAQRWRMRAYHFRKLWADVYAESNKLSTDFATRQLGFDHRSPWDNFVLQIDGDKVVIKPHEMEILEMLPANGIMPEELSPSETLDRLTGPAAPMVYTEEEARFAPSKPLTFGD